MKRLWIALILALVNLFGSGVGSAQDTPSFSLPTITMPSLMLGEMPQKNGRDSILDMGQGVQFTRVDSFKDFGLPNVAYPVFGPNIVSPIILPLPEAVISPSPGMGYSEYKGLLPGLIGGRSRGSIRDGEKREVMPIRIEDRNCVSIPRQFDSWVLECYK